MAGRGDNNKKGSAGRGAGNQSSQAFVTDEGNHPKSNHGRRKTGGRRSEPSPRTADPANERNRGLSEGKRPGQDLRRRGDF